jgi:hypothetical protein
MLLELLPDWFGRGLDGGVYAGPLTYCDLVAGFCGGAFFVFTVAAVLVRLPERRVFVLTLVLLIVGARAFRTPGLADLVEMLPQVATTGATRGYAAFALMLALLGAIGIEELRARPRRLAATALVFLGFLGGLAFTPDDFTLRVKAGEIVLAEPGAGLDEPPDLSDTRPSGRGATLTGHAPHGVDTVRISVNGIEKARVRTGPPDSSGLRPFEWTWAGSERLDPGAYRLDADAIDATGGAQRFDVAMARLVRPPQPSSRWAVHLSALALVLLAALFATSARVRIGALVLATVGELAFFGLDYNDTTPSTRLPQPVDPIPYLQKLRRDFGPFRIFAARTHLHPSLHVPLGIDSLRGYDALEPLDYILVLNELYRDHVPVGWVDMDFSTLDFAGPRGSALADVANVRFVLSEERAPAGPDGFDEVWRQQPRRPKQAPLILYENRDALPRMFLVERGLPWREPFPADPRACAIWDTGSGPDVQFTGTARIVARRHERGRIRATVESDAGTILVVSENVTGWRATIDGVAVEPRRTHGTFLSVVVPTGGRHEIALDYRPRSVVLGGWISAAGAIALLALMVASLGRFFRRPAGVVDEA